MFKRDLKKEETINIENKENEFDDSKIDIDNNRDIDLTNDYKQSAIGLSALIKIPEKQGGIQSISGLNNVLGSPKNTDNTIDTIIWTLIFSFLAFGIFGAL